MFIAAIWSVLLFTLGLITTLFSLPSKKLITVFQSLFVKSSSHAVHTNLNQPVSERKVERGMVAYNKAELKGVFATFDKNNDGYIARKELKESLKNIGIVMEDREIADIVQRVDSNGDGLIDFDEFCELFESISSGEGRTYGEEGGTDLKAAFDIFDGDKDGLISVEDLGLVLSSLGLKEGKKLEDCKEMIRKVDADGDGMVNFDEFKRMMKAGGKLVSPVS